ncbi:glycosyl hydrolase [candidate division KSB1 bacterium]|nr:glycosyl hydrolase [candidate division KSB1 bacterium]
MSTIRKTTALVLVLGIVTLLLFESVLAQSAAKKAAATTTTATYDTSLYRAMKWRSIGPFRGGRSTAVAGVPNQPLVYYMGGTGGGVWKTEDGGINWRPISDAYFKTGSVGAIEVAQSDPNVIYVGMGEACVRGNFSHGDGLYKSTDAGKTWKHIGLSDTRQIGKIRIHPQNPDLVYVAALGHIFGPNTERGVFRSKDGGKNWERILYKDDKTGAVDIAMDPSNSRILFAGFWQVSRTPYGMYSGGPGSGLYKSTDGGDTWTELKEGLPKGIKGKIGVTVSPVNPNRVWANIEAEDGGVFRSDDGGNKWRRVSEDRNLRQRAWYYTHIYADTKDPETVYVLNVQFNKSIDGGKTYETIRVPHGDTHDLWMAPEDNMRMINANDGGACVTFNGGKAWTSLDNQPTAQFYHVITDNRFPYYVYGAQQDNSTVGIASRNNGFGITERDWYAVGGGESGYIAPHPVDANIVYAGSYGGYLTRYDHRTQEERNIMVWPENPMGAGPADLTYRFQWTFPIVVSPHDPNTIYAAGNVLFKSANEGQTWEPISTDLTRNDKSKQGPSGGDITKDNTSVEYYCTIFSVAESRLQKDLIWAGSDDGLAHVTTDGGKNWQNVTPKGMPEWSLISNIDASPHEAGTAYLAVNRYKHDGLKPYIYKTNDYGKTWTLLNKGIPEGAFVRAVREDPQRKGLLYAGTETGVFASFDDGANWQNLQLNLPVVPITDMVVKDNDLVVATQGRSFWILDDLTPLHQLSDKVAASTTHLFKPRAAYRFGGGSFPRPNVGQNPPNGVVIHYYLKTKPEGDIRLEILDAKGDTIKTFSSKERRQEGEGGGFLAEFFGVTSRGDQLAKEAGMNRFVWDMRYPDAVRTPGAVLWGGSLRGPVAVPGNYQARLIAGNQTLTEPFEIKADPRLNLPLADYQKQFDFLLKVRDKVSAAHEAVNFIRDVRKQVDDLSKRVSDAGTDGKAVTAAAKDLNDKMKAIEEEIIQVKAKSRQDPLNYPIKLNNKIAVLADVASSMDAPPTDASHTVFNQIAAQLDAQLAKLEEIKAKDLPAFNKLVREQEVPAIVVSKKVATGGMR